MEKDKILSLLLVFIILVSSKGVLAENSDENRSKIGKEEANLEFNEGKVEGEKQGEIDGTNLGMSDGKTKENNMSQVMQKNIDDYERKYYGKKSIDYIDGFIEGYRKEFRDSYFKAYKDAETEPIESIAVYGAEDFGTTIGRIDGYIAYKSNENNNWEKYIPSGKDISIMFELSKESKEYRNGFIDFFTKAYKASFESAFQVAKLSEKTYSYEEGLKDGDDYSKDLADLNGKKDYLLGLRNDYTRNMPSNIEIINMFNLSNESKEYENAFLAGFEYGQSKSGGKTNGGYMIYYNKSYREANKDFIETPDLNGEEGGRSIGKMKGEYAAIIDMTLKKPNLWTNHKTGDQVIIDEYGLGFQSENYRRAFIIGYWDEFMKSYNETYKKIQEDGNKIKTHTERISIDGQSNISIPGDDKFLVDIDPGTYYNDVVATIDSIPNSYVNPNSERHTQGSEVYGLKIMNPIGTFDKNKNITIKFKSYGKDVKYGIYKYHYNKWVYLPSKQEEDYLTADINIKNIDFSGNIYAVRIDNQLPIFHEIRGHWGKDEITTYVKREIIYGYTDKTFKPDKEISRGEFVTMLSRLYDWYPPYDSTNVTKFKDYKEFGYAEKAISYATYYNVVNGYPDNTFRPHKPITYTEVEIIMSRVLGVENFKWDKYAEKLIYEKRFRSKSKDNMNNKITRAEFTFLLHQLNEEQY